MANILVVEDDPWSQRLVVDVLEMRGHRVITASDLDDARRKLAEAPDVILLDINVTGGGGELLLREIRNLDALRDVPVIAFTASAMRGDRERFLRQGFTAYLSKPIDVRTFGETIEAYVGAPR